MNRCMELTRLRARTEVYRLLSRAYGRPGEGCIAKLREDLRQALLSLGLEHLANNVREMGDGDIDALEVALEHTRLFLGPVKAQAYPYASMYLDGEIMGQSTMDVAAKYRDAGLDVSGTFKDLPDHICAEMEFMYCLCMRELDATMAGDQVRAERESGTARSFLVGHLNRWVPGFTDCVLRHATTPLYRGLARITRDFVLQESTAALLPDPV